MMTQKMSHHGGQKSWPAGVLILMLAAYGYAAPAAAISVAKYNKNPLTVDIPAGLPAELIENLMVQSIHERQWNLHSRMPNEVVAVLKHRNYDAKATLQSDGSVITIHNDSTYYPDGFNSDPVIDEKEPKAAVPLSWLIKMQRNLQAKFFEVETALILARAAKTSAD